LIGQGNNTPQGIGVVVVNLAVLDQGQGLVDAGAGEEGLVQGIIFIGGEEDILVVVDIAFRRPEACMCVW